MHDTVSSTAGTPNATISSKTLQILKKHLQNFKTRFPNSDWMVHRTRTYNEYISFFWRHLSTTTSPYSLTPVYALSPPFPLSLFTLAASNCISLSHSLCFQIPRSLHNRILQLSILELHFCLSAFTVSLNSQCNLLRSRISTACTPSLILTADSPSQFAIMSMVTSIWTRYVSAALQLPTLLCVFFCECCSRFFCCRFCGSIFLQTRIFRLNDVNLLLN